MPEPFDITYVTGLTKPRTAYQLASGQISLTSVLFEVEGICAQIETRGLVRFCDRQGSLLAEGSVKREDGGRECYEEIELSVSSGIIELVFPISKWIDNYPHCDGEHDRYDRIKIGERILRFDPTTRTISAC